MPYIKQKERKELERALQTLIKKVNNVGKLNYCISRLCNGFLTRGDLNYYGLNQVIGVLECAKLEFYRRKAGPYEDIKILENGDI
jgi:hypothetical protein